MKNIISRFNEIRKDEQGFTVAEALVAVAVFVVLIVIGANPVAMATQTVRGFIDHERGVNQGPVVDFTKAMHTAATKMKADHPDVPVNEQNVLADGNITVPAGMEWTVAEYSFGPNHTPAICVLAYSITEQTDKYWAEKPAEFNSVEQHKAGLSTGCYFNKKIDFPDGTWATQGVPNYNEEESFLKSPAPEPAPTTTTEPTTTDTTTGGA